MSVTLGIRDVPFGTEGVGLLGGLLLVVLFTQGSALVRKPHAGSPWALIGTSRSGLRRLEACCQLEIFFQCRFGLIRFSARFLAMLPARAMFGAMFGKKLAMGFDHGENIVRRAVP